jgi:acyl-homoserine lactone synthase
MEVHVVTAANQGLYGAELDRFFVERHRIYVEELHWRDPSPDGREIDQFDTDEAVYLIGIEDGRVITGSRFLPTSLPHLLSEVFPHLCDKMICDPMVAEWTRGFIVGDRRERAGVKLKAAFCAAVMDYCLDEGITRIGGIQEVGWLALWERFGWNVEITGRRELFGTKWWVPAYFDVSEQAAAGARRYARLNHSILVKHGNIRRFGPECDRDEYWAAAATQLTPAAA